MFNIKIPGKTGSVQSFVSVLSLASLSVFTPSQAAMVPSGDTLKNVSFATDIVYSKGKAYVANANGKNSSVLIIDAMADSILETKSLSIPPRDLTLSGDSVLHVIQSDFKVGALSSLDLRSNELFPEYVATTSSDNAWAESAGLTFFLDRTLGVATGFKGIKKSSNNVFFDVNVGANPYSIALLSPTRAAIARYGSGKLFILDPSKLDGGTKDSVDLSSFALPDPGLSPNMAGVFAFNGNFYVVMQRLNSMWAAQTAKVAVIDGSTLKIKDSFDLKLKNPIHFVQQEGIIYATCIAAYGAQDGGLESINLQTLTTTIEITESELKGDLFGFCSISPEKSYVWVSNDFGAHSRVIPLKSNSISIRKNFHNNLRLTSLGKVNVRALILGRRDFSQR